jgi:hypothetical protein
MFRNRWQGTYTTRQSVYCANQFVAGRLIAGGLPHDRMSVKPNFVTSISAPGHGKGGYGLRWSIE